MLEINSAVTFLEKNMPFKPEIVVILGSGLGAYADNLYKATYIDYKDIPGFPVSSAPSHKGRLAFAEIHGMKVALQQGRLHCYEGLTPAQTVIPLRALIKCGAKNLLATMAVGGVNERFKPGTLCLVTDHLNFTTNNPLVGPNLDEFGPRFCDMSFIYDEQVNDILQEKCEKDGVALERGVYAYMPGPAYETPAEIRALRTLGADLVGMSLVMEATAASHAGIRVNAIACVTNMAAGVLRQPLTLEEVIVVGEQNADRLVSVIEQYIVAIKTL